MSIRITELPYKRDSSELFGCVSEEPWSMFLDSAYPHIDIGRYDIIVARPFKTLVTRGDTTTITDSDGKISQSGGDPFQLVKQALGNKKENLSGLPFCGGALGYFSYDLGRRIEKMPDISVNDVLIPDMAIGLYDWSVIVDHHQRRTWLASYATRQETQDSWQQLTEMFQGNINRAPGKFVPVNGIQSNLDKQSYAKAFDRIKHYIREGDCYQVNLAQRFQIQVEGSSWNAFLKLRRFNAAPFSAFINIPDGAILSTSPERFLKVNKNLVETKPIKGTRRRSNMPYEDKSLAVELMESEKDRAENLMIVDLLRNDLGKNCIDGTVTVPKLFALESYATVHHLVSTVTGQLKPGKHALDLLTGCFPGGSITGAPKLRSMEIIEELEPHRRTVYCGSIGYAGFDGNMDCNIAIRTLVHYGNTMYCWAGGGIVNDSVMEAEYQECFDKAAAMLYVLESGKIKEVAS